MSVLIQIIKLADSIQMYRIRTSKRLSKKPFLNLNGLYKEVITKLQVRKIECLSYLLSSCNSIFDIP